MDFGKKIKFFNYRPMVSIFLFVMAGIIFAVGLNLKIFKYLILSIIVFILFIVTMIIKVFKAKTNKLFKVLSIFISFVLGCGLTIITFNYNDKNYNYNGYFMVVGEVCDYTSTSKSGLKIVSLDNVKLSNIEIEKVYNINCKLRLYLNEGDGRTKEFKLGEIVSGKFKLKSADYILNGEANFYMLNKNVKVLGFGSEDDIESTGKIQFNVFNKIKVKFKTILEKYMTEDYSSLGYTMLFGDKSNLDEEINESYSASGIGHLLAVSGLHVGFIVTLFGLFLSLFKANNKIKFYVISIIVFIYAFMCGFTVSVTRAMIMTIVLLFSKLRFKRYDSLSGLSLAGIIILLWNPLFVFDIGFILSFSAVASIIIFSRTFNNFFSNYFGKNLSSALSVSLSATIGTNLVMMLSFDKLSIFSVMTNMIVIPIASVAFMMMFGFVLISLVVPALGVFIYMFEALMKVVTGVGQITGSVSLLGAKEPYVLLFGLLLIIGSIFMSDYCIIKKRQKLIFSLITIFSSLVFGVMMFIC